MGLSTQYMRQAMDSLSFATRKFKFSRIPVNAGLIIQHCVSHSGFCTSYVTSSRKFCLNDETSGTCVFQHVAPGVVSAIVRSADGAAHVTPHPRWTARSWAAVAAGNTAWGACVDFGEAGLAVLTADSAARRHWFAAPLVGDGDGLALVTRLLL